MSTPSVADIYGTERNKLSFSDIASARVKRAGAQKVALLARYQTELEKGELTEKDVNALAETLSYVVDDSVDVHKAITRYSPTALYAWAVANASIAFPYMSLKEASEKVQSNLEATTNWGVLSDGNIALPDPSSLDDSHTWLMISALVEKYFPDKVRYTCKLPTDCPPLENDEVAKNRTIDLILRRTVELCKNPLSATIRTGMRINEYDLIKNAVDFVILEHIYTQSSQYNELRMSDTAVLHGRRSVRTEYKGAKGKVHYSTSYIGFRLADYLCKYVPEKIAKSFESEPFVVLILRLLRQLIPSDLGDYEIPKVFFEVPSNQLRKELRKGPQIKTAKGVRENLYAPFSFVKSSECAMMPIVTKKDATDLGSKVIQTLDRINKLKASEAAVQLPAYRDFLHLAYILSDTAREKWRKNLAVYNSADIEELLYSCIEVKEDDLQIICRDSIKVARDKIHNIKSITVPSNSVEEEAFRKAISETYNKKKRAST